MKNNNWLLLKAGIIFRALSTTRECDMPLYNYECLDCGRESLVMATWKGHESGKAVCPLCQSQNMKQLYSTVIDHTTKKS
jgi:putative FmdB family regulatory protein